MSRPGPASLRTADPNKRTLKAPYSASSARSAGLLAPINSARPSPPPDRGGRRAAVGGMFHSRDLHRGQIRTGDFRGRQTLPQR